MDHKFWQSWTDSTGYKRISALSGEAHRCNLYCSSAAEIVNVVGEEPYWHLPYVRTEYPFATFSGPYDNDSAGGDPYNTFRHDPEYNNLVVDILATKGKDIDGYGVILPVTATETLYGDRYKIAFTHDDNADGYLWTGLIPICQLYRGKRPNLATICYEITGGAGAPTYSVDFALVRRPIIAGGLSTVCTANSAIASGTISLTIDPLNAPWDSYFYLFGLIFTITSTADPVITIYSPKLYYTENENYHNYLVI
jgi:hypothetical protein